MLIQFRTGLENFQSLNINLPRPFPIFHTFFPFFSFSSMYSVEKNIFLNLNSSTLGFQFEFVSFVVFHQMYGFAFGNQMQFEV